MLTLTLLLLAADPDQAADQWNGDVRGMVIDVVDDDGTVDPKYGAVLPRVKSLNAISYRILLRDPKTGDRRAVDPQRTRFYVGDRFRIEIETHNDQYLYVFHEDRDGNRTMMIPQPGEETPKAKKGSKAVLPTDEQKWFRFTAPAGREILHILASNSEFRQLDPKRPPKTKDEIKKSKQVQDDIFETLASMPTRVIKASSTEEVTRNLAASKRGAFEVRGIARMGWNTVAKGSFERTKQHSIHVKIELNSHSPRNGK